MASKAKTNIGDLIRAFMPPVSPVRAVTSAFA
jgi:hypothetical protein